MEVDPYDTGSLFVQFATGSVALLELISRRTRVMFHSPSADSAAHGAIRRRMCICMSAPWIVAATSWGSSGQLTIIRKAPFPLLGCDTIGITAHSAPHFLSCIERCQRRCKTVTHDEACVTHVGLSQPATCAAEIPGSGCLVAGGLQNSVFSVG
jgi:hypothetical protein